MRCVFGVLLLAGGAAPVGGAATAGSRQLVRRDKAVLQLDGTAAWLQLDGDAAQKHRQETAATAPPYELMPCPSGAVPTTLAMTFGLYDQVAASVTKLVSGLSSVCSEETCPQGEWAGCVLRMAGHDFMDYKDGTGGSDGCTDLSDADNKGLGPCLYQGEYGVSLKDAYQNFCSQVSLADFIVIAGEAVMNYTRGLAVAGKPTAPRVDFRSQFKYGRTTATSCSFASGRLPDAEKGCTAVQDVFVTNMGLSWDEAAALMGTHTLGRARVENSGYDGWWTRPSGANKFDNDYYSFLFTKGWAPERVAGNPRKNQWTRIDQGASKNAAGKQMMLNTDMCLAYKGANDASTQSCCAWGDKQTFKDAVTADGGDFCGNTTFTRSSDALAQFGRLRQLCCPGIPNGPGKDCDKPASLQGIAITSVTTFAKSEASWLSSFHSAWAKATSNGFGKLRPLTA